jgi:hypothetical protein
MRVQLGSRRDGLNEAEVAERINIGVFLLWIVALAIALLRTPVGPPKDGLGD